VEAFGALVEYEEKAAPALVEELLGRSADERRERIRRQRRYQSLGLARHLTRAARAAVFSDVAQATELAELAREVADRAEEAGYARGLANDARALAWGAYANALRVGADPIAAERALRTALLLRVEGSGHPSVEAELLSLAGSLRMHQARYPAARELLEQAAALYRRQGATQAEAKTLIQLAKAAGEGGDAERAVRFAEEAEARLDPAADRFLFLYARQVRTTFLLAAGGVREARALYEELAPDFRSHAPGFSSRQRIAWLGARIAWAEGDPARAEKELLAVQEGFAERGEGYECALVAMDLATLQLEQGRTAEVKRLVAEMLPFFAAQEAHRHALSALLLVQRAVEAETATAAFLREVARYLRRARHNPFLPFDPTSDPESQPVQ
jgi:tetratricopeptide (TPR) repeat protein